MYSTSFCLLFYHFLCRSLPIRHIIEILFCKPTQLMWIHTQNDIEIVLHAPQHSRGIWFCLQMKNFVCTFTLTLTSRYTNRDKSFLLIGAEAFFPSCINSTSTVSNIAERCGRQQTTFCIMSRQQSAHRSVRFARQISNIDYEMSIDWDLEVWCAHFFRTFIKWHGNANDICHFTRTITITPHAHTHSR